METYLQICKTELINGTVKRRHPFRYFSLATLEGEIPRLRTVVLRKLLPDFNLLFYTDTRSQKVKELERNNSVSALFYHPKKLFQVRLDGKASIITDEVRLQNYWNAIPEHSRKDYITTLAPGTIKEKGDEVVYNEKQPHFMAIEIEAYQIEYLQLQRPSHERMLFTKENGSWIGQRLIP